MSSSEQSELLSLSALQLARLIRQRELSIVEITQFYLERIQRHNANFGAFVRVTKRRALRRARTLDQRTHKKSPDELPLFHGVPTGVKDLVPTLGVRTQYGSRAYKYFVPWFSAPVAQRMSHGGFISLGKLATSELGVMPVTETKISPPARNPWATDRTPGGSSGGSGAAVAAGLVPIAQASDGGGSIRIPAAFTHQFGFKPSLSLLGNLNGPYNKLGLAVMGPISRTVEDAAGMLDVMSGLPFSKVISGSCLAALQRPPSGLRIHLCLDSPVTTCEPEYAEATRKMATLLQSLGHTVTEVSPMQGSIDEFMPVWHYAVSRLPVVSEEVLQPITKLLRKHGTNVSFSQAMSLLNSYAQRVDSFLEGADFALTPTVPGRPPRIGTFDGEKDPKEAFDRAALLGSYTIPFNINHGPAAAIPVALTKDNLPISVQIGGRAGDDHRLLALCRQIEQAAPWCAKSAFAAP